MSVHKPIYTENDYFSDFCIDFFIDDFNVILYYTSGIKPNYVLVDVRVGSVFLRGLF